MNHRWVISGLAAMFFLLAPVLLLAEIRIHIVTTADVHGHVFAYDFVNNRPQQNSLAHVHQLVSGMRSRQGSQVILLENGDLIQGSPAAYYANFKQDSRRHLFSRVLNYMGYDAATVGNHDIEAGPAVYNRLKEEFSFPYLGANVLDAQTKEPYFKPYTIIRRQRLNIAVLGLTTPSVPQWLPPHLWEGLYFQDLVEAARYWVDHIQTHENADAIVGLFHSGRGPLEVEDPQGGSLEHASAYIARHVPGFDVIFTGHDHRRLVETIADADGNEVLLLGGGHFAETVAIAELRFKRLARRQYELEGVKGDVVSVESLNPSHAFILEFEEDAGEILMYANEQVGRLGQDMVSREVFFGPAAFTNLIHDFQLQLTGADLSFTAPLAFDERWRKGPMLVRDFFRLYQYENYLYTMELSGREIWDFLEYSYGLWMNHMQDESDHLLRFRMDADGRLPADRSGWRLLRFPFYNMDSAAGIRYTVDVSQPTGERVQINGFEDGRPFELEQTYRVAVNSYRGSGGGGHLTLGAGIPHHALQDRVVGTTETDLRSALKEHFRKKGVVEPSARDNWHVLPVDWAEKGRKKDEAVLFP